MIVSPHGRERGGSHVRPLGRPSPLRLALAQACARPRVSRARHASLSPPGCPSSLHLLSNLARAHARPSGRPSCLCLARAHERPPGRPSCLCLARAHVRPPSCPGLSPTPTSTTSSTSSCADPTGFSYQRANDADFTGIQNSADLQQLQQAVNFCLNRCRTDSDPVIDITTTHTIFDKKAKSSDFSVTTPSFKGYKSYEP